jgi:hypothetical protein
MEKVRHCRQNEGVHEVNFDPVRIVLNLAPKSEAQ